MLCHMLKANERLTVIATIDTVATCLLMSVWAAAMGILLNCTAKLLALLAEKAKTKAFVC